MKDPREMGDAELVGSHAAAAKWELAEFDALEAELLRRLSAGNPQAEKVQITNTCEAGGHHASDCLCAPSCMCREAEFVRMPERSDGRHELSPGVSRVLPVQPERSDGRIQGESGVLLTETATCNVCGTSWTGGPPSCPYCKAQRSAGRIEAGSEQVQKVPVSRDYSRERRNEK